MILGGRMVGEWISVLCCCPILDWSVLTVVEGHC